MVKTKYDSEIILNTWKGYVCLKEIDPKCKGIINLYVNGFSANYVNNYSEAQINTIDYAINNSENIQKILLLKISSYALENNITLSNLKNQIGLYSISIIENEKDNYAYSNYIIKLYDLNSKVYTLKVYSYKDFVFRIKEI
ncbi:hypothetical protein R3X25_07715 [Lutibacter sp. TH_r2]|uniref:hypothetical protein n=1 Tax=Lutibacter sp. TH_r2 TaxID=3082083 RepID=UPI002954A82C|nr:hypothetical protein [Lutibacter sp. TH_r2]MDV7187166.1 hypothetical protein [Lutibacter sp. TH_r2]